MKRFQLVISLLLILISTACGADSSSDSNADETLTTPDGIKTFLANEIYRGTGWQSETDGPREESSVVSPHDRVRVFLNDTLINSQRAGNGKFQGTPHATGSMAVKELYEEDTVVGHAVIYQAANNTLPESTVYYCVGPLGRCLTESTAYSVEEPAYGRGTDINCGGCHGGLVFTLMP